MTCDNGKVMADEKLPQIAGDLFVATCDRPGEFINFGGVKTLDAVIDNDSDRVEEKAQNRAAITGASIIPTINAELLESIDIEKIALVFGLTVTPIAGTEVTGHSETQENLTDLVKYPLEFKNANNAAVTVTSIIGSIDGALTVDNDYYVQTNLVGETCIVYDVTGGTTLTTLKDQIFTIVYTYTPAKAAKVTATRKYQADKKFIAKIVSEADSQGRVNVITLKGAIAKSAYTLDFADLATAGGVKGTTITFEGQRGSTIDVEIQTLAE